MSQAVGQFQDVAIGSSAFQSAFVMKGVLPVLSPPQLLNPGLVQCPA
jgi:hypothetical protein